MMPQRNMMCRFIATMLLLCNTSAFGQDDQSLDIAAALDAFTLARSLIDSFDDRGLPATDDPQVAISIPGATGVIVILRRSGNVIALASDTQQDQWMIRRAVGRALSQVLGSAEAANLPRDLRQGLATDILLELEVAGPMQAILATSAEQLNRRLAPGSDGLALRHQDRWFLEFPSAARAFNRRIKAATLAGLLSEAGLPPRSFSELAAQTELGVYRFDTLDLAQRSPQGLPVVLEQGDIVVEASSITPSRIAQAADEIAGHLLTTAWPGPEPVGLLGGYNPVTDSYIPLVSADEDQLLIALALCRYARSPRVDPLQAQQANELAISILSSFAARRGGEDVGPLSTTQAALIALAWAKESPQEASAAELHQEARDTLLDFVTAPSADQLSPHEQAIVVSALTSMALHAGANDVAPLTHAAMTDLINQTWQLMPEHEQVSLHPWLGWSVIDMHAITGRPTEWDQKLRNQRHLLQAAQEGRDEARWAPVGTGGIPLGVGTQAEATSQGLRPGALLATMLGQPHLTTKQELAKALESQLSASRFLVQLMIREDSPHQPRTPKRAAGGVRAALWDQNQPPAAQAMGLLMLSETLRSLRQVTKDGLDTN